MTKPKGTRHEATRAAEALLDGKCEDLSPKTTDKVLERSSRQQAATKSSKVGKNALAAPPKSEPGIREKKAIDAAVSRLAARAPRFSMKVHPDGSALGVESSHSDHNGFCARLLNAFGTSSYDFATQATGRLAHITRQKGASAPTESELNAALAAIS